MRVWGDGAKSRTGHARDGFDYGAERHGRIPGARHLMLLRLSNDDNTLRSPDELEETFRSVGAAPDQAYEVVAYCRLSHRASLLWFTATPILGWDYVRYTTDRGPSWGCGRGVGALLQIGSRRRSPAGSAGLAILGVVTGFGRRRVCSGVPGFAYKVIGSQYGVHHRLGVRLGNFEMP